MRTGGVRERGRETEEENIVCHRKIQCLGRLDPITEFLV